MHAPSRRPALATTLGTALVVALVSSATLAQPEPTPVTLTTTDSVRIAAFWFDVHRPGAPAALLLHDTGANHFVWQSLWTEMTRSGINVLALDLRGHGQSRQLDPKVYEQLTARDQSVYHAMVFDAEAGLRFLNEQHIPPGKTVLVGSELGSSIALQAMSRNPRLRAAVVLTPGMNYFGIPTLEHVKKYGKRPLLLITMKPDLFAGAQQIVDALGDDPGVKLQLYPKIEGSRGTQMLRLPLRIHALIVDWLVNTVELKKR